MKVLINFIGNRGYSADQIETSMTLGDLLSEVQEAVDEWGEDAIPVLHQTNNGSGANYGHLSRYPLFEPADDDSYDDAYGYDEVDHG